MGKLIDADICLEKAWQNFHKQEDEHEKNIDDYDILRDRFYEQSGFECCQQAIVNAQPVEAIPKDQYENRLKADKVAMLEEINIQFDEISFCRKGEWKTVPEIKAEYKAVIREKINELVGGQEGAK